MSAFPDLSREQLEALCLRQNENVRDLLAVHHVVDEWFVMAMAPEDAAADYMNGDDGRTDGSDGWEDGEKVHAEVRAAIAKAEGRA